MDARLFDGAFPAGDPHALRAAAPGSVRAHSLGRDRDGDRLARGDRRRCTVGRAGGRRDPRSLLKEPIAEIRARLGSGRHTITAELERSRTPYVRRAATVEAGEVMRNILGHLGLPTEPPSPFAARPPPLAGVTSLPDFPP